MSVRHPHVPEGELTAGTIIGDHLVIKRKLGSGGMGNVYLAQNAHIPDKRYAIKVLRDDLTSIARYGLFLEREAQNQARLDHENIVNLYDFFPWGGRYCLVLAYVEGTTLADMIAAEPGGLKEGRALDLMQDILAGVNHAHEHGVLHCDIKPANVLVDLENRVRVTDFGIARDLGAAVSQEDGMVIGTPEYMSPEQIQDPAHVDHRADVYSAGVLMFELLTGRLPFAHEGDPGGTRFPQLSLEPADIRNFRKDLSKRLSRIVATALQRHPAARFQGCMQFEQAIRSYRFWRLWRRRWLPAIAAALILAAIGVEWNRQWQIRVVAEQVAKARMAIESSIYTATTQLGFVCRDSARLEVRRQTHRTAVTAGRADLAEKLSVQISDLQTNLENYSRDYASHVTQLTQFDPSLVAEMMQAQAPRDPSATQFLQAIRRDYTALSTKQGTARTAKELVADCPR